MSVYKESLVAVCIRLTIFYWLLLTLIAVARDPGLMLDPQGFIDVLYSRVWNTLAASIVAVSVVAMFVYLFKAKRQFLDLAGRSKLGLTTTIGPLPMPTNSLPRVKSVKARLPILDERLGKWLLSQNVPVEEIIPSSALQRSRTNTKEQAEKNAARLEELNALARSTPRTAALATEAPKDAQRKDVTVHGKLFLAVWDTYCAHRHYPASHREGGHGAIRLHEHCLSVAARCLHEISPEGENWTFEGVFVKRRGRNPVKMFENATGYQPHREDPMIPLIGLAHDLGKLMAYDVDRKGKIRKNKEPNGNTLADDDAGVIHDVLGPRILSRIPEFWDLPPQDRAAINTAVAHYHHPSKIPLNSHHMINDPRAASLMMLMITADRAVSALEAGIDSEEKRNKELSEEAAAAVYETFVAIITTHGRINGVGKPEENAKIQIGQKHEHFIAIKMGALLALMRQELGISLEGGEGKHDLTNQLLAILQEKGLLYTKHNGVDFGLYNPLYRVSLYHHTQTRHLADLAPALLMHIPPIDMEEFYALTHLALNPCHVIVKNLILSHIHKDKIKSKANLEGLIEQAFGADEAKADLHEEVQEDQIQPIAAKGVGQSAGADDGSEAGQTTEKPAGGSNAANPLSLSEDGKADLQSDAQAATSPVAGSAAFTPPKEVLKAVGKLKGATIEDAARLIEKRRSGKGASAAKSTSVATLGADELMSAVPDLDLEEAVVLPRQARHKRDLARPTPTQAPIVDAHEIGQGNEAKALVAVAVGEQVGGIGEEPQSASEPTDVIGDGVPVSEGISSAEASVGRSTDPYVLPEHPGSPAGGDVLSEDEWNNLNAGYVDDVSIDAGRPDGGDADIDDEIPIPDAVDDVPWLETVGGQALVASDIPDPNEEPDLSDDIVGDSIPAPAKKPQPKAAAKQGVVVKRGGDTF